MKLIDTHAHFWNLANNINSWVNSSKETRLKRDYLFVDYLNDLLFPEGLVSIEASDGDFTLQEVEWLEREISSSANSERVLNLKHIGYIDLLQPANQLETSLKKFEPHNFVVGFRDIQAHSTLSLYSPYPSDFTVDKKQLMNFALNVEILSAKGYILNLQMYPGQLLRIAPLLSLQNIKCIIDHCGLPEILTSAGLDLWLSMLNELKNFAVFKISGLDINNNFAKRELIIERMLENVPAERLMFGSNYPVTDPNLSLSIVGIITNLMGNSAKRILIDTPNNFFGFRARKSIHE